MANISVSSDELLLRDAAEWWLRLRENDADEPTVAQWLTWLEADRTHAEAFEQINQLCEQVGGADELRRRRLVMRHASPEVSPPARRPWLPRVAAALAASLVLAVAGGVAWTHFGGMSTEPGERYASNVGQNEDFALPDGSRVSLGGASTVVAHFDAGHRGIDLSSGEAYFHVVHDQARPFVVTAGPLAIRDLGTAFNVRRTNDRVVVAVTEGRVRIAPSGRHVSDAAQGALELVAGQQVSYDPATEAMSVTNVTPEHAAAWRSNRLEFDNEPVSVVVANINRYSKRPVEIADAGLGAMTFTGTVRTDAIDSWLEALPQVFPVKVSATGNRVVLSRAGRL
ncbi:transmembrane sensor [Luteibacter sp. Sphag1AF]|uniref:FecR family protein n=1 Tax=Luteibacter sp. Sphag1AF TaxID=2587031 RepID=UPI001608D557|nr:FecR domain-containing protein [Luteibacter sp. Sphag1AF]MBB3225653.1 transmembrane sensor [Luteibacter sp. Sphag1AF]